MKRSKKPVSRRNHGFVALLVLFVGLSSYAMLSFLDSNRNFIEEFYADVINAGGGSYVTSAENPFEDLPADHPDSVAVVALYEKGILKGYADGTFKPDERVNRAEFAKILAEAADLDYASYGADKVANCFSDVQDLPVHWFATYVCAAKEEGWVSGYEGGVYNPVQPINRAEALKIVLTAFGFAVPDGANVVALGELPYPDLAAEDWYVGVAYAARDNGIIVAGGDFGAGEFVSRGALAQMIYKGMLVRGLL